MTQGNRDDVQAAIRRNSELRLGVTQDGERIDAMAKSLDRNVSINGFSALILEAMQRKEREQA